MIAWTNNFNEIATCITMMMQVWGALYKGDIPVEKHMEKFKELIQLKTLENGIEKEKEIVVKRMSQEEAALMAEAPPSNRLN